jgi:hypothetical protein
VTVAETLLVFVGAPLAVIALLALLIFVPAGRAKRPRYKPGQPWEHEPVWYEPHPEHGPAAGHGETLAIGSSVYGEPQSQDGRPHGAADPHGGTHGATAIGSSAEAHRPAAAGPLGGARGTW